MKNKLYLYDGGAWFTWHARVATVHRPRGRSPSGSMNQKPRALLRKAQAKRHRTSVLYDT